MKESRNRRIELAQEHFNSDHTL